MKRVQLKHSSMNLHIAVVGRKLMKATPARREKEFPSLTGLLNGVANNAHRTLADMTPALDEPRRAGGERGIKSSLSTFVSELVEVNH
jgi:hypothetical protein